jgi:hypothetical protein
MFLVLNTSGLTVIPISIMVYRAQAGAANPADSPLDTPVVTVTNETDPTTPGGTDGSITVTWPAVSGAATYDAGIADGLNRTDGFSVVSTSATSPYVFTGLNAGDYTVAIRAIP